MAKKPKSYDASNTDLKTGKPLKKYAPARVPPMDKPSERKPLVRTMPRKTPPKKFSPKITIAPKFDVAGKSQREIDRLLREGK